MLSMVNFVNSFGGDFFDKEGKKLTMDTPEFKKGFQVMYDVFNTVILPRPSPARFRPAGLLTRGSWAIWRRAADASKTADRRERSREGEHPERPRCRPL